jgi:hypothetical protein
VSIEVNIAVQRNRVSVAQELIDSLNKQTIKPDLITIILQGFKYVFTSKVELNYVYNESNKGSIERLRHCGDNINLIIDDDFVVTDKYIEIALDGFNRHNDAFCSFWGYNVTNARTWDKGISNIDCFKLVKEDIQCKMLGVGLSIWDESLLNLRDAKIDYPNYVDIQLAVHCAKEGIDMFKLSHPKDFVKHYGDEEVQSNALWKKQFDNSELFQSQYLKLISI